MKKKIIKNIPNMLSFLRIILIIISFILFIYNKHLIAIILILLASISDYFDGMLARKFNCISKFGSLLDGASDKLFELGLAILIIIKGKYLFIINVFLELIIFTIQLIFKKRNKKWVKALIAGKIRMWFIYSLQLIALIAYIFPKLNFLFIIFAIITALDQLFCIYAYYKSYLKKTN